MTSQSANTLTNPGAIGGERRAPGGDLVGDAVHGADLRSDWHARVDRVQMEERVAGRPQLEREEPSDSSVPASGVREVDVEDHRAILHTGVSHVKEDYGGQS